MPDQDLLTSLNEIPEDETILPMPINPLEVSPGIAKLQAEIGTNKLLEEATIRWVQMKKAELAQVSLSVLYTPEQLQALQSNLPPSD